MEALRDDNRTEASEGAALCRSLEAEKELTESLVEVLQRERQSILAGRLEELYRACRQRGEMVERVRSGQEATAEAIARLLSPAAEGPRTLSTAIARSERGLRPRLRRLQVEINRLRREVSALSAENTRYATEALNYLESAVAILTGADREPATYGERRPRTSVPAHVCSEV